MSTDGHWCQLNANRNPQFWVQWRGRLFSANSSIVIQLSWRTAWLWGSSVFLQLNYDIAWLWNSTAMRQPWHLVALWDKVALGQGSLGVAVQPLSSETTAPLQSTETGQLHSGLARELQWYSSSWGDTVFSGKGKCTPQSRGELTIIQRSRHP